MAADEIARLYREAKGDVSRAVSGIVDAACAEDLVHDAFVAYLDKDPALTRPAAWLARVARNRAINLRSRRREVRLLTDPEIGDPSVHLIDSAARALVAEAVSELPARARKAIELRYMQVLPYERVAAALGVKPAQARVVVHRSVRRLGRAIVRRLADTHGAGPCSAALEGLAGIAPLDPEHRSGPCKRCSSAWDEIVALRTPVGVGILAGAARWLGAVGERPRAGVRRIAASLTPGAGTLSDAGVGIVAAAMTFAATFAGGPTAPSHVSADVARAPVPVMATDEMVTGARTPIPPETSARPRAPGGSATSADDQPTESRGPVTIERDHIQAETDGDTGVGIVICEPLAPCPPAADR